MRGIADYVLSALCYLFFALRLPYPIFLTFSWNWLKPLEYSRKSDFNPLRIQNSVLLAHMI